jgi:hypothetical protein
MELLSYFSSFFFLLPRFNVVLDPLDFCSRVDSFGFSDFGGDSG